MRKLGASILIICLFCFPHVYFSMFKDFESGSMIGYLLMIILSSFLAFLGKFFNKAYAVYIGNVLSFIVSYYFISQMSGNARWGVYFKPLTPEQLLILVSVLNLIPQMIAMKLTNKKKAATKS